MSTNLYAFSKAFSEFYWRETENVFENKFKGLYLSDMLKILCLSTLGAIKMPTKNVTSVFITHHHLQINTEFVLCCIVL